MAYFMRYLLLIAILLLPSIARAGHPLEVEDTATEGKGNFLFELTGDYAKDNQFKTTTWTGIITGGTGEHTDVSLEVPYLLLNPSPVVEQNARGIGDVKLTVKGQIFENEVKQSMAYLFFVDMRTGDVDKGLGKNDTVWGVKLIDSQECKSCIFHVNAGYEVFGKDLKKLHFGENYAITFGLAAGYRITNSFRVLSEIAGEVREEGGQHSQPFTLLGGIIYDLSKSWYVDLGVKAALNKYAPDYTLLARTAWKF